MNQQSLKATDAASKPLSLNFNLRNVGRSLLQWLHRPTELQVWQEWDEQGHCFWSAYDPQTKRSLYHISEQQMRCWIEQRHRL